MAASTINRSAFTNGTTAWNAAAINSSIYDKIDELFGGVGTYATLELGGALKVTGALTPVTTNTPALGSASLAWADLFLGDGAVINFNNSDVTITHSTNTLTFAWASSGYVFADGPVRPATNDGAALGVSGTAWSDLFLASGSVINFNAGDVTITHSSNTLTFAGAASGYIFNDGNVGIGVTPSAWGSIFQALQVGTGGSIFARTSGNQDVLQIASNTFWDGSNWKYLGSVAATKIEMQGGGLFIAAAPSGTAGNNITFTDRFGILNGGNVAIGATAKFYFDGVAGTGDSWFQEGATANTFEVYVGGTRRMLVQANAIESYGGTGVGFRSTGSGTSTGTAIIRNSSDEYFYLQSSSRRFKENIAPAVVTDAQLDAFMATAPSWWDYKGQKNGALGFIAEDLAALPLDRYGFNPLVNYDGNGDIESNRDYALIAMHHLVMQRLERKIAALEARIH